MIVTNNPVVRDASLGGVVEFVSGDPLEVLNRVDQLLDEGWHLVTGPLSANNRLNRSPYRSVLLSKVSNWTGDDKKLLASGLNHLAAQGVLKVAEVGSADQDYQTIDLYHIQTAYQEAAAIQGLLQD